METYPNKNYIINLLISESSHLMQQRLLTLLEHMCFSCYRTYVMILGNWLIL